MSRELLFSAGPRRLRAVLREEGRLWDYAIERAGARSLLGDVYFGRVSKLISPSRGAFVDIGLPRAGFLRLHDDTAPHEGAGLWVQVDRDATPGKGVRLRSAPSFPGCFLIFDPADDRNRLSRRLRDAETKKRVQGILDAISAEDPDGDGDDHGGDRGGFVARTAAAFASEGQLRHEAGLLRQQANACRQAAQVAGKPALLHHGGDLLDRSLRDWAPTAADKIYCDDPGLLRRLEKHFALQAPRDLPPQDSTTQDLAPEIILHAGPLALFESHGVEDEIDALGTPRIRLPSGGEIVIEQTEALCAVDVNMASGGGRDGYEQAALNVNLEAAREVPRQLRLRDIGGLIVVDFLRLKAADRMDRMMAALRAALAQDPAGPRVAGPSPFGLVEITRRRQRAGLAYQLYDACGQCGGSGRSASAEAIADAALEQLCREARAGQGGALILRAAPAVIAVIRDPENGADLPLDLVERIGARVQLTADPSLMLSRYEISPA